MGLSTWRNHSRTLSCSEEHFPASGRYGGAIGSRGCAPASLPRDANKPLTFQRVPALVETRGAPRARCRAPRHRRPAGEGRQEGWEHPGAPEAAGTRVPIPCPRPRRQPPAARLRLQLKLTPNVALMSGLHLISPAPGKEGPAGLEKDHTWQLLIETRPPVTGGSSFLLKRLLITNEPCLCFGCDAPLCSPAPPPPAPRPGWRQRPGGSGGGGSCGVGSEGL